MANAEKLGGEIGEGACVPWVEIRNSMVEVALSGCRKAGLLRRGDVGKDDVSGGVCLGGGGASRAVR